MYRESLREALTSRFGVDVVGEAGDGRTVVTLAREVRPDVVILQAHLPDLGGAEATRQLRAERPELAVIALSTHSDHPLVTRVLKAGAQAFVLASGGLEELERALQAVREGNVYLSPDVEAKVVRSLDQLSAGAADDILTQREIEVLQLLAEGKSTKRIAAILSVSPKTVETHRLNIMTKLGLFSVAELTRYAIRQGIATDIE
jgi:DNA-binding NarL/FixJ family response regulator